MSGGTHFVISAVYIAILVLLILALRSWARTSPRSRLALIPIAIPLICWACLAILLICDEMGGFDVDRLLNVWVTTIGPAMLLAIVLAAFKLTGATRLLTVLAAFLMLVVPGYFFMVE